MRNPTVSVIIATYNRGNQILSSLKSILGQSFEDLEVVVVDDGSTDGTTDIVGSLHDDRIRYLKLEKNGGATVARNHGIENALGKYIMIWDSDDVLFPTALEKLLQKFKENSDVGVVSSPAIMVVSGNEEICRAMPAGEVTLQDILCKRIGSNEKVRLVKSELFSKVRYVSKNIDFLVNVGLRELSRWYHLEEPLGTVFNNPHSGSLTAERKRRRKDLSIERSSHLKQFLDKHSRALKEACPQRYADYCYGTAVGRLLADDINVARGFAKEALTYSRRVKYFIFYAITILPGGRFFLSGMFK